MEWVRKDGFCFGEEDEDEGEDEEVGMECLEATITCHLESTLLYRSKCFGWDICGFLGQIPN